MIKIPDGFNPITMSNYEVIADMMDFVHKNPEYIKSLEGCLQLGTEPPFAFRIPFSYELHETARSDDPTKVAHYTIVFDMRDLDDSDYNWEHANDPGWKEMDDCPLISTQDLASDMDKIMKAIEEDPAIGFHMVYRDYGPGNYMLLDADSYLVVTTSIDGGRKCVTYELELAPTDQRASTPEAAFSLSGKTEDLAVAYQKRREELDRFQ